MRTGHDARRARVPRASSFWLAAVTALLVLLAGCGSGGGPAAGTSTPGPGGTSAQLLIWADPAYTAVLSGIAEVYGQASGVVVTVKPVPAGQMRAEVSAQAQQGQGPDLFLGESSWIGPLVDDGLLAQMDLGPKEAGFTRTSLAAVRGEGRTYAMPLAGQGPALLRNTALAPKAPATVEALVRRGHRLVAAKRARIPLAMAIGSSGDAQAWYPLYSAAGGYLYGARPDGGYDAGDLGVGLPGSVQAGRRLAALLADGAVDPDLDRAAATALFVAGGAAYLIGGPDAAQAAVTAGIPLAVDPVPGFADSPENLAQSLVGFQAIMLSAFARDRALAVDFATGALATTGSMDALAGVRPGQSAWRESLARAAAAAGALAWPTQGSAALPTLASAPLAWRELDGAQVAIVAGTPSREAMANARARILAGTARE